MAEAGTSETVTTVATVSKKTVRSANNLVLATQKMCNTQIPQNSPRGLLGQFPTSMLILNTVQMFVAQQKRPVTIDVSKIVEELKTVHVEAQKGFEDLKAELREVEDKLNAANKEDTEDMSTLMGRRKLLTEDVKKTEKAMNESAVNPALLLKLEPSLAANCSHVVNEVRSTLLIAHKNNGHMQTASTRLIENCECLKADKNSGREIIAAYMTVIGKDSKKMVEWADEVSSQARFTTLYVNTVQKMINNTICSRDQTKKLKEKEIKKMEEEQAKIKEDLKRRQEKAKKAATKALAAAYDIRKSKQEIMETADEMEEKMFKMSVHRITSFGKANDATVQLGFSSQTQQQKINAANKELDRCIAREKLMEEEALKQEEEALQLMNCLSNFRPDTENLEKDVQALQETAKVLENVKEKIGLFQLQWDKLSRFFHEICVVNESIGSNAENAATFSNGEKIAKAFTPSINKVLDHSFQACKICDAYNTMSNTILFPMTEILMVTSTTNWKTKSPEKIAEWNEYVANFYREKSAQLQLAWGDEAAKKIKALEAMKKKGVMLQEKVGTDQLSDEYFEEQKKLDAEVSKAPILKAMKTAAKHTLRACAGLLQTKEASPQPEEEVNVTAMDGCVAGEDDEEEEESESMDFDIMY